MQIWAESGKSALPICNYSQILYQFLTFTQNLKRSLLNLMDDPILLMDLDTAKANRRFKKLCAAHGSHCKNVFIVDALNYLATCSEPLSKVHKTTAFKDLLSKVNSQF